MTDTSGSGTVEIGVDEKAATDAMPTTLMDLNIVPPKLPTES
jgi:hypothetical protein